MTNDTQLALNLTINLSLMLRFDGCRSYHKADGSMADITTTYLVEYPVREGLS